MNNREIPIFFSIDDNYAALLAVALNSVVKNASKEKTYKAIILHQALNSENITRLKALEAPNFKIEFVAMRQGLDNITDYMSSRLQCDYWTLTIFFRLFIPTMFPQYDKAIYIDSDVALCTDISELFETDIGENYIGACQDRSIEHVPDLVNYVENAVGVPFKEYINSGVLLMDLKKLRELNFEKHFLNLLNTYRFESVAPDQDYINAICNGNIYYLDERWDAMPNNTRAPLSDPKLVHYNLFEKPWCYDQVQYADIFWKYAKDSGYWKELTQKAEDYTDEERKADGERLAVLVGNSVSFAQKQVTFKTVHESGVKIRL